MQLIPDGKLFSLRSVLMEFQEFGPTSNNVASWLVFLPEDQFLYPLGLLFSKFSWHTYFGSNSCWPTTEFLLENGVVGQPAATFFYDGFAMPETIRAAISRDWGGWVL